MTSSKHIIMVMPIMQGGGAERVAALLLNNFHKRGAKAELILTSCTADKVLNQDLDADILIHILQERLPTKALWPKISDFLLRLYSSLFCRFYEWQGWAVPAHFAYCSFICQYRQEALALRQFFRDRPQATVIAFLQPSIPMLLLAARGLSNKVVISERGNPERLISKRYGLPFMRKYYGRVDAAVFQTDVARNCYPINVSSKGVVIPNPLKNNLPDPYVGKRNKNITTFCRVSVQKNLPLLLAAFAKLHQKHPDYRLRIIGDAINSEDVMVQKQLKDSIKRLGFNDSVDMLPFSKNVHKDILQDAMYINSSDYEGMSNSMLEAMAIGLPVICTDCPIGGARAIINHGENGLLVPVNDIDKLFQAMKLLVEDQVLAQQIASQAAKIRKILDINMVTDQWLKIL
jgi:GalNAc-alpha-(1->4)-GalNAc-alpha-(1->3)-diNAcBac-PP-undecaprenol alpha-1,4-N-acetyl-D-galactosaminyltransferase